MEELKEIIKKIQAIGKETNLTKLDSNTILDCAVRIFNSRKFKENKPYNPNEPITEKQKNFLITNGYEGEVNKLTKREAQEIIKEAIEKKEENI